MNIPTHFQRLWQIGKIVRQYGLDADLEPYLKFRFAKYLISLLFGTSDYDQGKPFAVRLREALQELGPIFVKFGQIMSTRPDLFPEDIIQELSLLQDQVPAFDSREAKAIIEKSLGAPIESIFSQFDEISVASASVAQVHHAVLQNGDEVVVKVLRPDVNSQISRDVEVMLILARLFRTFWPKAKNYHAVEAVKTYGETMVNSLDLMIEAANANRFRTRFQEDEFVYVPKVYWNHTHSNVMVIERVGGIPIREIENMKSAGIDLTELAENLVKSFFVQAFYDGFFHGDLHPGNLFVSESGQLRIVDFGIMGNLTDVDRQYLAENIMAILRRDYQAAVDAHIRAGWAPHDISLQRFEVSIRTLCEQYVNQPVGEISFGRLMGRMFRMTREFGINIQPQLLLFQKTYLNLEGLTRMLDPELDISKTVSPVLESWARQRFSVGRLNENIKMESPHWISVAPEIPRLVHSVLSNMQENQMREQGIGSERSSRGPDARYRGFFFALLGSATLIAAILDWNSDGFGFLTLLLGVATAVCLNIAWPRKKS